MLWLGFGQIAGPTTGGVDGVAAPPQLRALTLSSSQFPELSDAGTVIGTIQNRLSGTTLSIDPPDGRFAVSSDSLVVGLVPSDQGDYPITITESDGTSGLATDFTIQAFSSLTFDSTRTKADSTRTSGGLEVRATLISWNAMLAQLAEQRGM